MTSLPLPHNKLVKVPSRLVIACNNLPSEPGVPPLYMTRWTRGDGACMFSAVIKAMGVNHTMTHKDMRASGIRWMADHQDVYRNLMEDNTSLEAYMARMSNDKEYGDHAILHAICQAHRLSIVILKVENGKPSWNQVSVEGDEPDQVIWLYLNGDSEHYENLLVESQVEWK